MGRWTTLTDPNAVAGASYTFGAGLNVNGNTVTFAQTDPSNMLYNRGFEDSPPLAQWTQTVPGAFSVDTSTFYQGKQSAKTSTAYSALVQTFYVHALDQFLAGVFYRSSTGATGTCTLLIVFKDATGAILSYVYDQHAGSTTFAHASCSGPAPTGSATMEFWIRLDTGATGTWYFDDASLRRIAAGDVIQVGAIATSHLAPGSLGGDLSKYSSTIRAIAITNGLPSLPDANYPQGCIIFNTFDGKEYRNTTGTAWSKGVAPEDLIAGTIAAGVAYIGEIECSQVNAGLLNANVGVYAESVQAGAFTGCSLTLTANGVTTTINNSSTAAGVAGLQVAASGGDTTYIVPAGLAVMYGSTGIATIADGGFGGVAYLYAGGSPVVSLEAHAGGGILQLTGTTPQVKMGSGTGFTGTLAAAIAAGKSFVGGVLLN